MQRRSTDHSTEVATTVLACPSDHGKLQVDLDALVCPRGHTFLLRDGFFDLWPPDAAQPGLDWFSTPYGVVYDTGIKERWLARLAGRIGWGADIGKMYDLMDEGVKCAPGQVVVDVPCGGAPPLRAAAGRLQGTYVGIDLSESMLMRALTEVHAEGLENVVLVRGDATRMPLKSRSVDRILCFNGLHVLPDKAAALREFHRVLRPGGEVWGNVVTSDPTLNGMLTRPWFSRPWLFFHPADPIELEQTAIDVGFYTWDQDQEGSMVFFRGARAA
jgi:SAM-dependent methyltransferase